MIAARLACARHAGYGESRSSRRADCLDYCRHRAAGFRLPPDGGRRHYARATSTRVGDPDVNGVGWDILLVLAVILIGGFFAAAEMALVSLREGQVRALARRGKRGQRAAKLAQDPNRFLSSVQIGVTLATLLSGAFGAATCWRDLKSWLVFSKYMPRGVSGPRSLIAVTLVDLLLHPDLRRARARSGSRCSAPSGWRSAPARSLDRLATLARPLVWLLSRCTNLVVKLLGGDPNVARGVMTDEELRDLVAGHQALSPDERHIVGEVFDAGKRQIREVLVPRTEVEFLPASMPLAEAIAATEHARYSRFPVYQESYDDVIGFVHARDLLDHRSELDTRQVGEVCRPVKFLPISKTVLSALSEMRKDRAHLAIVRRRVRRHRGHRHAGRPGRGADRRHPGRVRRGSQPAAPAARWRARGRRPAEPGRVRRADRP